MGTQVRSDADEKGATHGIASAVAFASIWAYALAAGFVALGITQVIAVVIHPRYLRVPLQWAAIPVVALLAGLSCESALTRVRSLIAFHHRDLMAEPGVTELGALAELSNDGWASPNG